MRPRPALVDTLRSVHLRVGLAAVVAMGVLVAALAFLTVRTYVDQNLTLVARSIAYSAEAAVVFGDAESAAEVLTTIAARERLLRAEIADARGRTLARYPAQVAAAPDAWQRLTAYVSPQAQARVVAGGTDHGTVTVRGNGDVYLMFVAKVLAAIGLSMAAIAVLVSGLARRIDRDIVEPLRSLAVLTRRARLERGSGLRAPPAAVREIHELGEDFNALLAEVESREATLVAAHDTLRTANESLAYLAHHDPLTGLHNRNGFRDSVHRMLAAHEGSAHKLALLFVDCDRFKAVNDRLGHAAGDALLVALARRLGAVTRDGDVVARLGGDEFAVLLGPVESAAEAAAVAGDIARALCQPVVHPLHGRMDASASIGVALLPDHGRDLDTLMAAADAAMYRAKAARGGGTVVLFEPVPAAAVPT